MNEICFYDKWGILRYGQIIDNNYVSEDESLNKYDLVKVECQDKCRYIIGRKQVLNRGVSNES
jgi:hypothetical protein